MSHDVLLLILPCLTLHTIPRKLIPTHCSPLPSPAHLQIPHTPIHTLPSSYTHNAAILFSSVISSPPLSTHTHRSSPNFPSVYFLHLSPPSSHSSPSSFSSLFSPSPFLPLPAIPLSSYSIQARSHNPAVFVPGAIPKFAWDITLNYACHQLSSRR